MEDFLMPPYKAMSGFEVEYFLIDRKGEIAHDADLILKDAAKSKNTGIKREVAKNFIEIAAKPHEKIPYSAGYLIQEIEALSAIAEKYHMQLLPLGCHPGSFAPSMRREGHYGVMEYVLGKSQFKMLGRCCGFHCHFTLPHGIFDEHLRMLKLLTHMKVKDRLVNSYNLLIASDPALTTFMQSSPFYQGNHVGKDSRMIIFRGGKALGNTKGAFGGYEQLASLPPYKHTAFDIVDIITTRYEIWGGAIQKVGINLKVLPKYWSLMDTTWNAIKVNPNGTLEERGMDINHLQFLIGSGVMMHSIMKKLQNEAYTVIPSEAGIANPFKVEGDIIHIPPFPYVKKTLQNLSAYKGLESREVRHYCTKFLRFAESAIKKEYRIALAPLKKMLRRGKTVSDEIIEMARKGGWKAGEQLSKKAATEIALHHAKQMPREIESMKAVIGRLM
jgi:hypothetical protein